MAGSDYVKDTTCKAPYHWQAGDDPRTHNAQYLPVGTTQGATVTPKKKFKVAAFDYGAKFTIFRKLVRHGFDVHVFPATATHEQVREYGVDAVFLSNGPGDPSALPYIHQTVSGLLPDYPIFGICLGHQMLTHALGGTTFKLKFGHRGGNQPVKNLETGKVSITAQNHGFATDPKSLEKRSAVVTEINLNDNTVEGLRHKELPVFSVQYHPEAAPGPNDADPLFTDFYKHGREAEGREDLSLRKARSNEPPIPSTKKQPVQCPWPLLPDPYHFASSNCSKRSASSGVSTPMVGSFVRSHAMAKPFSSTRSCSSFSICSSRPGGKVANRASSSA
jgi:carbamoylphosphate synthase small subunit